MKEQPVSQADVRNEFVKDILSWVIQDEVDIAGGQ